jgi:hypothetical protein
VDIKGTKNVVNVTSKLRFPFFFSLFNAADFIIFSFRWGLARRTNLIGINYLASGIRL